MPRNCMLKTSRTGRAIPWELVEVKWTWKKNTRALGRGWGMEKSADGAGAIHRPAGYIAVGVRSALSVAPRRGRRLVVKRSVLVFLGEDAGQKPLFLPCTH